MCSCEESGRLIICLCLRVIDSLLQSVHSTVKVYRVQASIPCQNKKHKDYLPTYLPTQRWYLPNIGTYHTQNGNRYVGKTSNPDMLLLQLVQKYFPTSSFSLTAHLPEKHVSGAAQTHLVTAPNKPFRACCAQYGPVFGHLGTKPKEPRKCCLGS